MSQMKKEKATMRISSDVVRQIRQHARSSLKTEVCGVLVGGEADGVTSIEACIAGINAAQGGAHVTFTQDTWEHIYNIKDRDYPNERILGWYHSHPGFGVFLSDHDTFIHKNFFSSPRQVAWVYDPHSDEEGCFGWRGTRIERLTQFSIVDGKGGELAGETGKPEPAHFELDARSEAAREGSGEESDPDPELSRLARTVGTLFSYLVIFLLGVLLAWYVFPRVMVIPVPVDPQTGLPLPNPGALHADQNPGPGSSSGKKNGDPAAHSNESNSRDTKRDNAPQ
jgi:proteasome lid subunit RPN8/RPN11